ncbi:Uncharacterised protein [Mycobacteroides abscessus subsp. abscessus]|uniref:hypothetical protein n=1 Tax=Mycobacteroides abscessus TaxID=36809 RepID=UPI00092B56FE|nr:hypothetical protein [Mycobacteroides abscessus]SHY11501.1 Uncharacterised protein [Mycobacteroides abscessus subsp. abscessus]SID55328.1 Uncharacterised protein [Mycobacteroides abscessus subsp. abscessus]SKO44070.1 Uncharacterised protein [Mycobacteroides abscessus subsp. abscessus]
MSEAQKIMSEVIRSHDYGGTEQDPIGGRRVEFCGCGWRSTFAEREHADHVSAEVDKALGGLTRSWAAVWPDDSYATPWSEKWNFHPNKSARELAEADVAEREDTTLKSHFVSGWTVTE